MPPEDPRTLGRARDGAILQNFMPYINAEMEKMLSQVDKKAFAYLESNQMSPEKARELWVEKHILWRLQRRLRTEVAMGKSAGEQAADVL